MTLDQFYKTAEDFSTPVFIFACSVPVLALILNWLSGKEKEKPAPWKYLYSILIYLVTVPGILQAIITGYLLFILKESLMKLDLIIYILPIISMIVTLVIIARSASLKSIPGFDRLSGLMTMIGISIILALIISKTNIWLFFGGSMFLFFILIAILFLILKIGSKKLFKKKE
ncbi:MAG: hypothetical protein HY958_07745 [Bacteroidia bacterium]|nr:hypothetical protein [Bacteroidia bacterium]